MKALQWCMLGLTSVLLVAQISVSQLCSSFTSVVDSYHTIFLLMHMVLPHTQTAGKSQKSSSSDEKPGPGPGPGQGQGVGLGWSSELVCGLSYRHSRAQAMGALVAALTLASLCIPSLMEICGFALSPGPVRRPLLLVGVGAAALLHNMLVLGLGGAPGQGGGAKDAQDSQCYMEVNHKALAEEETKRTEHDGSSEDSSLRDRASSIPEDHQNAAARFAVCESWPRGSPAESPQCRSWLHTLVRVTQTLLSSALVLLSGLVMLANGPLCPDSSHSYSPLVFLDPSLAGLATVMLLAKATPEVRRYGWVLLQGAPPHISVPDLKGRIASVPGVDAVHEFHIWELTSSVVVASVHVRCHATLTAHRLADVMSGVNKVLRGAGVSCCTIQPEFAVSTAPAPGSQGAACKDDPSPPPAAPPACSLACGTACRDSMCCSPEEDDHLNLLPRLPEETLVIENNFK